MHIRTTLNRIKLTAAALLKFLDGGQPHTASLFERFHRTLSLRPARERDRARVREIGPDACREMSIFNSPNEPRGAMANIGRSLARTIG